MGIKLTLDTGEIVKITREPLSISINGKIPSSIWYVGDDTATAASFVLTGTTLCGGAGVFEPGNYPIFMRYHNQLDVSRQFQFAPIDFVKDSSKYIKKQLKLRIQSIRAWVESFYLEEKSRRSKKFKKAGN